MIALEDVYRAFSGDGDFYIGPREKEVIRVVFAAVLANRLGFPHRLEPLWLMLVAPPGGMKSTVLMAMDGTDAASGVDGIEMCDTASKDAFVSGYRDDAEGRQDPSYLRQLNGKTLCVKDLTTLMSKAKEAEAFMGALRTIYDQVFSRRSGNLVETTRHDAHVGVVMGIVPDGLSKVNENRAMGERFLLYRYRPDDAARTAIIDAAVRAKRNTARSVMPIVKQFFDGPPKRPLYGIHQMEEAPDYTELISRLSRAVSYLRGIGARSVRNSDKYEPEVGGRLAKQLRWLGFGLAALDGAKTVEAAPHRSVLINVATGSMPWHTIHVLESIWINRDKPMRMTANNLYESVHLRYGLSKDRVAQVVRELATMEPQPFLEYVNSNQEGVPFQLTPLGSEVVGDFFKEIRK